MTVGYAERASAAYRASLAGLKVAVDVQHLYQEDKPKDRGAEFSLLDGSHVYEAGLATIYAASIGHALAGRGAQVLANDPAHGIMVGHYWTRNRAANAWDANLYLACHVNAGGGQYGLAEYMVGTSGSAVGAAIASQVQADFPLLTGFRMGPIIRGQRGAVCIEAVDRWRAALLLEPFFGDSTRLEPMLATPELVRLGVSIADGIAAWYKRVGPPKAP